MQILIWFHLVGAGLWLGGLVTLAMAVLIALPTLPRELFRTFVRRAGWGFTALSSVAWLLIGASGIPMAAQAGWPGVVRTKTILAAAVLAATGLHVVTGRLTGSWVAIMTSRTLAVLVLLGTLLIFWLGVRAAG